MRTIRCGCAEMSKANQAVKSDVAKRGPKQVKGHALFYKAHGSGGHAVHQLCQAANFCPGPISPVNGGWHRGYDYYDYY